MNTIVSFEIAKLLKEKGFNNKVSHYWNYNGEVLFSYKPKTDPINYTMAPAIAEVVMWLYDKHGIWISAIPNFDCKFWKPILIIFPKGDNDLYDEFAFNSPTEAYLQAIEYALNNLI